MNPATAQARPTPSERFVVAGARWGAAEAGLRKGGGPDLGLIVFDAPSPAAGVFTRNRVRAAPVVLTERRVRAGRVRAVLVNAGCANACTGSAGMRDARRAVATTASALGVPEREVVCASTGVIGQRLAVERIERALPSLVASVRPDGAADFARAILTTDRWPKLARADVSSRGAGGVARVVGVAKGAGMIHPNLATTLAFVVTDARLDARGLRRALRAAVRDSFNAISVDGDTSTNDCVLLVSTGRAGPPRTRGAFEDAVREVLGALARAVVADGEGAEHLVEVVVRGARSARDARRAAHAVATSLLVKTALHGADPNWGRILAALGRSGARFAPDRVQLWLDDVPLVRDSTLVSAEAERAAAAVMRRDAYRLEIRLGSGRGASARMWTCDLGPSYVKINAEYRS
ncbi:MAG: bifunctional glutamate N-acetyltransferase/amino-acid acetyltransferase ArgJ [Myxococcales bacterium]|nr:bifunctional glutamate N-acetyltransferase/amino-acid acetyltransferase ArgJ [Myxococcales bacterium]